MARAIAVCPAGRGNGAEIRDTLLLTYEERSSPSGPFTGLRGTVVEIALPATSHLDHDDLLLLDKGGAVAVVARPEALLEVRAKDTAMLARSAWLLGDHHIPVEIHARYLRVRPAAIVETLLRTMDVTVRRIEAPFEAEGGAYDRGSGPDA